MALLMLRKLLYGRRVISNLPIAISNASGKMCAIRARLSKRQASAKEHHDSRGVKDLPVLSRGQIVRTRHRTLVDGSPPVFLTRFRNRISTTLNRLAEESCDVIEETSAKQLNNTCCCTLTTTTTTTTIDDMRTPNVLRQLIPTLPSTNESHRRHSDRQQFVLWSQLAPALVESSVLHHGSTCDEANICKIENIKKDKVAHPYNCSKYIDCSGAGNTFLTEGDVWHHEKGNVYDPQTGASATSGTVGCATQTNPALCATSPCANGGICEDTMSGFKCHCPFGRYNGPACENKLITCENVTCLHGTCEDTENGFYCNCSENYVGINCDDEKVLCSAAKCQNGATCTDTDSGYRCECPVMFTGVLCETEYKFCEREMPCRNGGTCVDLPEDKHVCVCPNCGCSTEEPYENCTIDGANICKTENMKHHLVAHPYNCSKYIDCSGPDNTFVKDDYVNNYQSGNVYNPDNGWADTPGNVDCAKQNDPTPCAADTCANGGTCEDSMSGFKCYCPFGQYNGPTCEN
ncbi:hypothetical protein LSAT2_031010, partial [Lamellibrachia satsuma]